MEYKRIFLVEMVDGDDLLTCARAFTSETDAFGFFKEFLNDKFDQPMTEEIKKI